MNKTAINSIVLSTFIMIFIGLSQPLKSYGQQQQSRKDKIEALKVAFLTNRMKLTPAEAQVFWPLYNEYNFKLEALKKDHRKKVKSEIPNLDSLSTKEIEAFIDSEMAFRQKEVDLQKEYLVKYKQVLPVRKVADLYIAEEAFKRELLKRLNEQNRR